METNTLNDYIIKNLSFLGIDSYLDNDLKKEIFSYYLKKDLTILKERVETIDATLEIDKVANDQNNRIVTYYANRTFVIQKYDDSLIILDFETKSPLFKIDFLENGIRNCILNEEIDLLKLNGETFEYNKFVYENGDYSIAKDIALEPFKVSHKDVEYYNLKLKTESKEQSILLRLIEGLKNNSIVTIDQDNKINDILSYFDKFNDFTKKRTLK